MSKRRLSLGEDGPEHTKKVHLMSPLDLLNGDTLSVLILDWVDIASQYFFFQTCKAYWFGTDDETRPSYTRNKRPLYDVWRSIFVNKYEQYFKELAPVLLKSRTYGTLASLFGFQCNEITAYVPDIHYAQHLLTKDANLSLGRHVYSTSRMDIISQRVFTNSYKLRNREFASVPIMVLALLLRPDADEILVHLPPLFIPGTERAWVPSYMKQWLHRMYDRPSEIYFCVIWYLLYSGKAYYLQSAGMHSTLAIVYNT